MEYGKPAQQQGVSQETRRRTAGRAPEHDKERAAELEVASPAGKVNTKQSPGLKMSDAKITVGAGGERNLGLEKFWARVQGPIMGFNEAYPCGFSVKTLSDHGLEVVMEQLSYRRTYNGTGAIQTQVIPVAAIGTKGRVVARDTTTGETVEQPWTWHLVGGSRIGLIARLWRAIKQSILNTD